MRYLWFLLFVLVLAAPFAARRMLMPRGDGGPADGGAEKLVIVTPHNQDIRNEFARAFQAWHVRRYGTPITLDYRVPGGSNDVRRLLNTTYRAYRDKQGRLAADFPADFDVAWGGGDFLYAHELEAGVLQPIHMPPKMLAEFRAAFPAPSLAGVRLYDPTTADGEPTPRWIGVCLSSFGICYNPDVYRSIGLPPPSPDHGWSDLADPRLRGFIALADPGHSGSAAVAFQMIIQRNMKDAEDELLAHDPALAALPSARLVNDAKYRDAIADGWHRGMSQLLKIAANARYFTDSSTLVPMDVSRGEAAAGMAIDFYARVTEECVGSDRIRYFAPAGATAITPDPVAILGGVKGRTLELARHFIEFLLSPEGQRLWILKPGAPGGPLDRGLRRPPIRRDLYADRTNWADDANPSEIARGFNERGGWMALFADARPVWVAAWIDSREALEQAYGRILRVTDVTRRDKLIDELADLPITMADVEKMRDERTKLKGASDELELWSARQQIEWAAKFREHYRGVGERAD